MRVRLCFFVKVLNASGRRVAGGNNIGRTVDFATGLRAGGARIGAVLRGLIGCTGVPNAGDEEGMASAATAEGFSGRLAVAMSVVLAAKVNACCTGTDWRRRSGIPLYARRGRAFALKAARFS